MPVTMAIKHNKQHDARAASFRRIAKGLRVRSTNSRRNGEAPLKAEMLKAVAEEIEHEGRYLRTLR